MIKVVMADGPHWNRIIELKTLAFGDQPLVWHECIWYVLLRDGQVAGCYSTSVRNDKLFVPDFYLDKRACRRDGFVLMLNEIKEQAKHMGLAPCGVVDAFRVPMLKALAKEGIRPTFVQVEI